MAKVNTEWTEDSHGTTCLRVYKSKGKLSEKEVYEALERRYAGRKFIHLIEIVEIPPVDYYEDGDAWNLYDIEDLEELKL